MGFLYINHVYKSAIASYTEHIHGVVDFFNRDFVGAVYLTICAGQVLVRSLCFLKVKFLNQI